ncbi:MAG: hypothetical protein IPH45_21295 [Bacteroidales bacterium]|nr:hypothetical protein [Bacteroidales bacterium]
MNSAQAAITVNTLPLVDAGTYGPVCIDAADIALVGTPLGGSWTGTGKSREPWEPVLYLILQWEPSPHLFLCEMETAVQTLTR